MYDCVDPRTHPTAPDGPDGSEGHEAPAFAGTGAAMAGGCSAACAALASAFSLAANSSTNVCWYCFPAKSLKTLGFQKAGEFQLIAPPSLRRNCFLIKVEDFN